MVFLFFAEPRFSAHKTATSPSSKKRKRQSPKSPLGKGKCLRQCDRDFHLEIQLNLYAALCHSVTTTTKKACQTKPLIGAKATYGEKISTFPHASAVWGCKCESVFGRSESFHNHMAQCVFVVTQASHPLQQPDWVKHTLPNTNIHPHINTNILT